MRYTFIIVYSQRDIMNKNRSTAIDSGMLNDPGFDYRYYETIDSTNNEAKRLVADEYPVRPLLILAGTQTAGRGRQGRSFYSPEGTGIYMTLVIPTNCPITSQVTMTTRTAVAVALSIEECFGLKPSIKWVNDIYLNERKCCGILCEAVNDYVSGTLRAAIVGVGINIFTSDWPDELRGIAGSLLSDTEASEGQGRRFEKQAFSIAGNILKIFSDLNDRSYLRIYRAYSNVLGCRVRFEENGCVYEGTALDVDDNGGLIVDVDTPDGSERSVLSSGEISLRKQ